MRANAVFLILFGAFTFLHVFRMASVSYTWDEAGDLTTVTCLEQTQDPFACTGDISQTRLPFYLHALAGSAVAGNRVHYVISYVFSAITLLAVWWFARRELGEAEATLTAALYVTSPPLLAAGRMVLTHSNIIFTAFTTLSFLALYRYVQSSRTSWLVACGVLSGASAASHPLAVFNGLLLILFYVAARKPRWRDAVISVAVAAATFFGTTIIYTDPRLFAALVDACRHPGGYPQWNYLGMGVSRAPWFFPFVLFVIKVGPWWLVVAALCASRWFRRNDLPRLFLACFAAALLLDLLLKGAVFHYETPHHQVQFQPLLCLLIASLLVHGARRMRGEVAVAIAVCFAIQLYDVVRFFPNYLFYGSQYGDRFIGEFYGPAVMHAQDKDRLNAAIDRILAAEPNAKIVVADNNALDRSGPNFVVFSKRDPSVRYEYAFVDRLYEHHFHMPESDAYNAFLAAEYRPYYTYYFPPHVWMYRVLQHK